MTEQLHSQRTLEEIANDLAHAITTRSYDAKEVKALIVELAREIQRGAVEP